MRIDKLADQILNLVEIVNKKIVTPATVKAVEESCVICGGAHAYYNCIATDSNQSSVCAATGTYNQVAPPNRASNQMAPPGFAPMQNSQNRYNQNQGQGNNFNRGNNFHGNQGFQAPINHALNFQNQGFQNQPFQAPNNQVQQGISNEFSSYMKSNELMMRNMQTQINNKQEESLRSNLNNDIRSILVERETEETTDKEQTNFQGSIAHIQPPVIPIPISEPDVPKTLPKPNIPYPSRLNDQKLREKATNQMEKLFELAKIPLNENCSAMLLKKLPKKLGDPGKFLIPCDFPGMDVCHALADLGASINLMPLSIWKKLSLPELTPTRMTLELADRSITRPKGVAEDVFVKVGKFHFPTNIVVVDFDADPRVPLILRRSFLRTGRALIDVYGDEITLRVNNKAITFNLNQTTRYSSTYDDMSINRIDVIDVACEEYAQEVLGFSNNSTGGNPTPTSEPIISDSSLSLTPFEGSDFILEEIEAYLKDDSISSEIDHADFDPEGDILLVEKFLNDDPSSPLPPKELNFKKLKMIKSSIDDFPPFDVLEEKSVTFSNPLFNSNDYFTSSDDESLLGEDVPKDNLKIYSNPLFEFGDEYISSEVNPLFNEELEDIESNESCFSNLDEPALLVTHLSNANEDECFDPGGIIDEIDAFLDMDISTDIENGYHDSEGDIIYLESLLIDDTIPNLPPEVFLDHEPRSLKDEPDNDDLMTEDKVFNLGIWEIIFSPTYVKLPFENRHYLSFTYVIRIFLPYFTYPMDSFLPLSSGSEDTIFDPGISVFHFSSLEPVAFESQMEVCSSTCFIPNITMIWGESSYVTRLQKTKRFVGGTPCLSFFFLISNVM
ncbi:reverse transcriptase domain-containing protein [Tanacetum coccineum]